MELQLSVVSDAGEEDGEAVLWGMDLARELSELDDAKIEQVSRERPDDAKGLGEFASTLAQAPAEGIAAVIHFVQAWVTRTGRTVEASIDGDTIKIAGASRDQQDRIIDAWLVRHAAGT